MPAVHRLDPENVTVWHTPWGMTPLFIIIIGFNLSATAGQSQMCVFRCVCTFVSESWFVRSSSSKFKCAKADVLSGQNCSFIVLVVFGFFTDLAGQISNLCSWFKFGFTGSQNGYCLKLTSFNTTLTHYFKYIYSVNYLRFTDIILIDTVLLNVGTL